METETMYGEELISWVEENIDPMGTLDGENIEGDADKIAEGFRGCFNEPLTDVEVGNIARYIREKQAEARS